MSPSPENSSKTPSKTPYRQIRAHHDADTITVYQAYNTTIAAAAISAQKLNAFPAFSTSRMTWIKPSWCWMMYRSGYSLKDAGQARILAIKMRREHFRELLMEATVCEGGKLSEEERRREVRVQWDPERDAKIGGLGYRSIQIGVCGGIGKRWVEEWIVGIEDVTEMALAFKNEVERGVVEQEVLEGMGLWPVERAYEVDEEVRSVLKMDVNVTGE